MKAWEEKGVGFGSADKGAKQMRLEIASMFLIGKAEVANNYRRATMSTLRRLGATEGMAAVSRHAS